MVRQHRGSRHGRVSTGDGWGRNFPSLILILFTFPVGLAVRVSVVHVLAVGSGVRESFEAFATLEWFLAAVQPLVLCQVVFVLEGLWTLDALVRALTCVGGREVGIQISGGVD